MNRFTFSRWVPCRPLFPLCVLALLACSAPALPVLTQAEPSATTRPTRTPRPTFSVTPTDTVIPTSSATATLTVTSVPPTSTTAPPTNTAAPKAPTNTPRPPTNTPPPPPTQAPQPTAIPATEFTGSLSSSAEARTCKVTTPFIAIRVVDRAGTPLPGYYAHIGMDGNFSKWTFATTSTLKDANTAYAHNADWLVAYSSKYYVTVFRQPQDPFSVSNAISNEVTVYFPPRDDDNCLPGGTGIANGLRVAPISFVLNR